MKYSVSFDEEKCRDDRVGVWDLAVAATTFAYRVVDATRRLVEDIDDLTRMKANRVDSRNQMADSIIRDIESL